MANQYSVAHGHSRRGRPSAEYQSWMSMKSRCLRPSHKSYVRYGGRGIKICDRWLQFETFFEDMGPRPAGTSLDRIDNYGNYEPGNCRWATPAEQQFNTRMARPLYCFGKRLTLKAWARKLNMSAVTIARRIDAGLTPEQALTRKAHKGKPLDAMQGDKSNG